jgi:enamine deaminase RidA (YjgF/YER057c/UK114 family)
MNGSELLSFTETKKAIRKPRNLMNVALHTSYAGDGQTFFVASVPREEDAATAARELYSMIAEELRDKRMQIVHERVFGSLGVEAVVMRGRTATLSQQRIPADGPVTYIEGRPCWGEGLAGVIIHAVSPDRADDVWTIMDGNKPCGRGWRRNGLTYLLLQNIQALRKEDLTPPILPLSKGRSEEGLSSRSLSKSLQTRHMLERAERILRRNGASYKDVARTWLYLSEIVDWYPDFNKVRSEKYGEFGIMPGPGDARILLPASTGIGANLPSGAAASMDLLAVIENGNMPSPVRKLANRGQLDAFRYGAAFSRGAVIEADDVKLIHVSGTAAIDEHGVSLYPGDIRSQIDCTLDKVETLLGQEGAGLSDICAATVFVKQPEYASLFWEMAKDRGLDEFPAVCVVADVCREELLFEIDAEVVVNRP